MKRFLCLGLIFLLAACGTSPEPEYYTLSAIPGASQQARTAVIKVRRPLIPETIDRPEMVSQSDRYRIKENDNRLWSEPLDTMIERVLAEDLRSRLPHATIVTESGGEVINAAYVLDVEVQQFGTDGTGQALLEAQAIVREPNGKKTSFPVTLHGGRVNSAESMAKTLSVLLGEFADKATRALKR